MCEECLDRNTWLCLECSKPGERVTPEPYLGIHPLLTKVFFLGFFLIFAGTVLLVVAALTYGLPQTVGLVVFIGPIPIILGAGEYSFLAVVLAVILTILSMAFYILFRRKNR